MNNSGTRQDLIDARNATTQAAGDRAQAAYTTAWKRGQEVGAKAERARIRAILNCAEAQGRQKMAHELALEMGLDFEAAKKILALAPKEAPGVLAALMANYKNPEVGPDADYMANQQPSLAAMATGVYARREYEQKMHNARSAGELERRHVASAEA
jgi:hypothetical protein